MWTLERPTNVEREPVVTAIEYKWSVIELATEEEKTSKRERRPGAHDQAGKMNNGDENEIRPQCSPTHTSNNFLLVNGAVSRHE